MAIGSQSFSSGFSRGFGLVDSYQKGQKNLELKREALNRDEERYQTSQKRLDREEARALRQEEREQLQGELLAGAEMVRDLGGPENMTEEQAKMVREYFGPRLRRLQQKPSFMASPEGAAAAEVGDVIMQTGDTSILQDPAARHVAARATYEGYVNSSRSGKPARSGKPREGQVVLDAMPVPNQPGKIAVQTGVRDEGQIYQAPLTERGSPDADDNVRLFDAEQSQDRFMGYHALYRGMEQAGIMPYLRSAYAMAGGDPSDFDAAEPEYGTQEVKLPGGKVGLFETRDGRIVDMNNPLSTAERWQKQQYKPSYRPLKTDQGIMLYDSRNPSEIRDTGLKPPPRGKSDIPLSPNQVISRASAVRRQVLDRVDDMLENFQIEPEERDDVLEEIYEEELNAIGLSRDIVNQAAIETGRAAPQQQGIGQVPNDPQVQKQQGIGQEPNDPQVQKAEEVKSRTNRVLEEVRRDPSVQVQAVRYDPGRDVIIVVTQDGREFVAAEEER